MQAQADLRVVGTAASGEQAMPGLTGIQAARRILATRPATRVVMFSAHDDPGHIRRALAAGASGYVLKEAAGGEIIAAIRAVHAGRRYLSERIDTREPVKPATGRNARRRQRH